MGEQHRSVSLPKELVDEAEELANNPKLKHFGHQTHNDLIRVAVQCRINTLKTQLIHLNHKEKDVYL